MKVLLIKMSALGDIVHCFPVVTYLRSIGATIDWVVDSRCASIPQAHPDVSKVIAIDTKRFWKQCWKPSSWQELKASLREERYDLLLDLQGNIKSGLMTYLADAREKVGLAWSAVSEWPNLLATQYRYAPQPYGNIADDYLSVVKQHLQRTGECAPHPLTAPDADIHAIETLLQQHPDPILLCPGSRWPNKRVPLPVLQEFVGKVQQQRGRDVLIIWGSDQEKQDAQWLAERIPHAHVVPRMSIPGLQQLMTHCQLVITMDSLPLHLAGAVDVPTFSVFGASSAQKYAPRGERHLTVQGACPYGQTFVKRCKKLRSCKTGACINNVTSAQLWEQFAESTTQ